MTEAQHQANVIKWSQQPHIRAQWPELALLFHIPNGGTVGLIRNIDRNEALLNGEFDRGKSRIIASTDLLRKGRDGRRRLTDNLFVGIDDDPEAVGLTIFSPELREQSFPARKQSYLRAAESIIGLNGLLSEVESGR